MQTNSGFSRYFSISHTLIVCFIGAIPNAHTSMISFREHIGCEIVKLRRRADSIEKYANTVTHSHDVVALIHWHKLTCTIRTIILVWIAFANLNIRIFQFLRYMKCTNFNAKKKASRRVVNSMEWTTFSPSDEEDKNEKPLIRTWVCVRFVDATQQLIWSDHIYLDSVHRGPGPPKNAQSIHMLWSSMPTTNLCECFYRKFANFFLFLKDKR